VHEGRPNLPPGRPLSSSILTRPEKDKETSANQSGGVSSMHVVPWMQKAKDQPTEHALYCSQRCPAVFLYGSALRRGTVYPVGDLNEVLSQFLRS